MTTRSGKRYQKEVGMEERMTQILQELLEDRKRREVEIAAEKKRQEETLEKLIVHLKDPSRKGTDADGDTGAGKLQLNKLTEGDDIEAYLTTFERVMHRYGVGKNRWSYRLAPNLTGKAQQAFAALPAASVGDYDQLKAAILKRYDVNQETYRLRFREAKREPEESYSEMAIRLADLGEKWTKDCSSVEEIRDLMVLEQFIRSLTPEIRMWVRERKPKKVADAAQLADQFAQARKLEKASFDFGTRQKELSGRRDSRPGKEGKKEPTTCFNCGETGHYRRNCPKESTQTATDKKPAADKLPTDDKPRETKTKACYNCGKRGHLAWQCNSSMLCQDHVTHDQGVCRTGKVEGKLVADIILDTGCTKSLVRSDLVPTEAVTGSSQAITIRCTHGDTVLYPLATISVEVDGLCFSVCAAVSDTLPVSLLLGTDVSALGNLLQTPVLKGASEQTVATCISEPARTTTTESEPIIPTSTAEVLVVTRAQSKRAEDTLSFMHNLPFAGIDDDASVFPACRPEKKSLTRREKRLARKKYCSTPKTADKVVHHPLDMTPQELQGLQENDPTLVKARKVADGQRSTEAGDGFFWKNDLLYQRWTPIGRNEEMVVDQIVLPKSCHQQVLHLAHTIPLAGHLGRNKTAHRVMRRFYWPTLFRDVADYCRRCPECQRSGGQKEQ